MPGALVFSSLNFGLEAHTQTEKCRHSLQEAPPAGHETKGPKSKILSVWPSFGAKNHVRNSPTCELTDDNNYTKVCVKLKYATVTSGDWW